MNASTDSRPEPASRPTIVLRSRLGRGLLVAAGSVCVVLGVVGLVVPLLPTTPFLLLAAACVMRSSERLHAWLYANPLFGDYLRRYQAGEGLPLKAKVSSLTVLWLSLGSSAVWAIPDRLAWVRLLLLALGLGVTRHILRLPTRRN